MNSTISKVLSTFLFDQCSPNILPAIAERYQIVSNLYKIRCINKLQPDGTVWNLVNGRSKYLLPCLVKKPQTDSEFFFFSLPFFFLISRNRSWKDFRAAIQLISKIVPLCHFNFLFRVWQKNSKASVWKSWSVMRNSGINTSLEVCSCCRIWLKLP